MSRRVALVGCGRISQRHAEVLASGRVPGAKLAAVCDVRPERATKLGTLFDVPWFTDMHEMMLAISPDLVSVLTESGNHARHVIELSEYGCAILVEKPMALKVSDADGMIEACRRNGVELFVVKQNRFNLPVRRLKEALDNGRLGTVFLGTVRVRWAREQDYYDQDSWRGTLSMDGGVLANQASHHLDLLEWMLGNPVSVSAMSIRASAKIEAYDTAVAVIRFESGALGVVEATTATRPKDLEGSLSVLGSQGSVVIGGFSVNRMDTWNLVDEPQDNLEHLTSLSENPPDVYGFGHLSYYAHVMEALNRETVPLVDGAEGRKSVLLLSAINAAISSHKEVSLDTFRPE